MSMMPFDRQASHAASLVVPKSGPLWQVTLAPLGAERPAFRWDGKASCEEEAVAMARLAQEDAWSVAMTRSDRSGQRLPSEMTRVFAIAASPLAQANWQIGGAMRDAVEATEWRTTDSTDSQRFARKAILLGCRPEHGEGTYYGVEVTIKHGQKQWRNPPPAAEDQPDDFALRFGDVETVEQFELEPAAAHAVLAISVIDWIETQWPSVHYLLYEELKPEPSATMRAARRAMGAPGAETLRAELAAHLEGIGARHAAKMIASMKVEGHG